MLKAPLYEMGVTTVKKYGDSCEQVTWLKAFRNSGVADDRKRTKKNTVNEDKLDNNIQRARTAIKELALCNSWDYWCTFTLSPEKFDRYNLKGYVSALGEFLHSYNRRLSPDSPEYVRYLLVPEMHKDGAWHMHGFIKGIRESDLYTNKNGYVTWRQYEDKFGFISMKKITGEDGVQKLSSYMSKYTTKDIFRTVSELGAHLYYHSKGLRRAETVFKGHAELLCDWDWEHPDGFCKKKIFDSRSEQDISECLRIIS